MKISRFFYTIRQGIKNLWRNSLFTLASVGTMTACLFLFGVFYCMVMNFQSMVKTAETSVSVTVFFEDTVTETQIKDIQKQVETQEAVDNVVYTSSQEAWEEFKKEYFPDGNTDILAGLDEDNPLASSANLQVFLKDTSKQSDLIKYIKGLSGVREVNGSEIVAESVSSFSLLISYISLGVIIILALVAIFLISNTVMIGITVRKEEIAIMKYLGATDLFVRGPFLVEGITIGLLGSAIPVAVLRALYPRVVESVMTQFSVLNKLLVFLDVNVVFNVLIPATLAIGLGIGFIGSYITVRKHVKV